MRMNSELQIDRLINSRLFSLQFWKLLFKLLGAKIEFKSSVILWHGTSNIFHHFPNHRAIPEPKNILQIINFGFPWNAHKRTRFSLFYEIIIRQIRLRLTLLKTD